MVELLFALLATVTGIDRPQDPGLMAIAERRVVEIQADFSHNGYVPGTAEVIAWNRSPDPIATLVSQWQGSPPHWAILTDSQYTSIGCAVAQPDDRTFGVCVLASGAPIKVLSPPPAPKPTPAPPVDVLLPNTAVENPMNTQPVALNVAIGTVISTGVTLAALLWPDRLSPEVQVAIIAFANSVIFVAVIILTKSQVTPLSAPRLESGSEVTVLNRKGQATGDSVLIQPTPPGPIGVEGGADEPPPDR